MLSPFHAMYTARQLSEYANGADRLIPSYASSNIEIYPYQIAAAMFALRSPYLKGAILADEGSLGKTYESLLVISQLYFEGHDHILVIVPTPLLRQWVEILENRFSVPFTVVDRESILKEKGTAHTEYFDSDSIVLITYEYAVENAEHIERLEWNIVVFEEAHRLSNPGNKTTTVLKAAVGNAFKLLLTAAPMQNSIMDLYGLIDFIDTGALGDADEFYKQYFRKPENYGELTATASRYCFRTLRSQVESYVNIPHRIPVTSDYPLSAKEVRLAALVDEYLQKPDKLAFPKMESYDLTLMFTRALASSPWALARLCDGAFERSWESELGGIAELAAEIKPVDTGKGKALLQALKAAFIELKKKGANRKVIIFTENKATLGFLSELLSDKYSTLAFDGSRSSDYSVIKKFKDAAEILITTDVAAEGFNLECCSFVVNFDLPYNVLTMEQRIMRCHRQGQLNDVVVLNFLSNSNFADARTLELINKRVLQFDGIMGMSDDLVGNFTDSASDGLTAAFRVARHKKNIDADYQRILNEHKEINTDKVQVAENALFTTFTRDIAEKVTVTPQYIKDRTTEINTKLWELVKWFFHGKQGYIVDDETKTLCVGIQPQKVFTGTSLRAREYVLGKTITPASSIIKNIIGEIFWHGIHDKGSVTVNGFIEKSQIGYYRIKIKHSNAYWCGMNYYSLVGKTRNGQMLTYSECCELMDLSVESFSTQGGVYGDRDGISKPKHSHELDALVDVNAFIRRAAADTDEASKEEVAAITELTSREKSMLNREINSLKNELRQIDNTLSRTAAIADRIDAEKKRTAANRELKKREQSLFMDGLKLDADAEAAIQAITDNENLTTEVTRMFAIDVEGKNV